MQEKIEDLYRQTKEIASQNPILKGSLAGHCAGISVEMLPEATQILGNGTEPHVGWFEINGRSFFKPPFISLPKWLSKKSARKYHCWLQNSSNIIDLTVIETLRAMRDFDDSIIPEHIRYIGPQQLKEFNLTYHSIASGIEAINKYRR